MRWASGFLAFGIAYSLFVGAIFWKDWPSIENPHLFGNLENKLSQNSRNDVVKIIKASKSKPHTNPYQIKFQSFEIDSALMTEIIIANGDSIILDGRTNEDRAHEIAKEYLALLTAHVHYKVAEHKFELVVTIFIPLMLLAGFAWISRTIWNVLSKID